MLRPNIGTLNALIRITLGFTLLSWGTATLVRRSLKSIPMLSVIIGSMKVAEGITRFCPVVFLYEERQEDHYEDEEDFSPMNPS
ncbi:hypothetical protein CR194_15535 [Salipaludibacillus keqinensis]|uniref:Inner membrane protein YgaP-like transmembrane domain-containing protein n=1 Tax=Salipaludibacillus keqinensis TaxID=2045207 RepID=A0A323T9F6_9BACI|nr:DUF2892 domain-containing protein [Salipaludibacillus keqinensis]PYZ92248.1 hypothetical protein CR194_15535 [Salipaludibacillus keqinensis]